MMKRHTGIDWCAFFFVFWRWSDDGGGVMIVRRGKSDGKLNDHGYDHVKLKELDKKIRHIVGVVMETKESNNIYFLGDRVACYNDDVFAFVKFKSGMNVAVHGVSFLNIVSRISVDELGVFIEDDGGVLKIEGKGYNFKIPKSDYDQISSALDMLTIDKVKFKTPPKDFAEGLASCLFSVGKDTGQFGFSCLQVDGLRIISSDNIRVSRYSMSGEFKKSFMISGKAVESILRFTGGKIDGFHKGKSWLYFRSGSDVICARVINLTFPDSSEVFNFSGINIKFPKLLSSAVDMISVIVKEDFDYQRRVTVEVSGDEITIRGEGEAGFGYQSIPFDNTKNINVKFKINPDFFRAILSKTTKVKIGTSENKVMFRQKAFEHLIGVWRGDD